MQTQQEIRQIDTAKLDSFIMRTVTDLAAGHAGVMVSIGTKLGLYKAMAGAGPLSAAEVAQRAGCSERYVREWLFGQVAGGYIDYHAVSQTFELSPEHAMVLADENSPTFMPHAWQVTASMWLSEDRTVEAFRTGAGVSWADHDARLFCGVAAFYRNAYRAHLVPDWLPALDGVVDALRRGILVADVGCGHGHSTLLMADAFPQSRFVGFDAHEASIASARRHAAEAGLDDRVDFQVARATDFAGRGYGLVCYFDALHDMGDPVGAVRHATAALAPGGTVVAVEPYANDRLEQNISPVARLYYSASASLCCPNAVADGGRLVLGAQAGGARLLEVFRKAGLSHARCAVETPFNMIVEGKR